MDTEGAISLSNQPEQLGTLIPTLDTRLGRMLSAGRLTATMRSKKTEQHITVTLECLKKGEKWQHVEFAEATHVFIKKGDGGFRAGKVGTFYPKTGKLYWSTDDKAWRYAALKTLQAAVNGAQDTEAFELRESSLCGKCGKELTDPVSIERGIGPTCVGMLTGSQHYKRDEKNLVEDLSPVAHHQRQVARRVLQTNDVMNAVLGGPTREEAEAILDRKGRNVPRTFEALAASVKK